jgi:hypothetical protein
VGIVRGESIVAACGSQGNRIAVRLEYSSSLA